MHSHRTKNMLHSLLLLAALVALLWLLGWFFAGIYGVIWATLLGIIPLFASIRIFPALTLKMYGARPLAHHEAPRLLDIVTALSDGAELPAAPRLYYIGSNTPLIFSVGLGKEGAIAVTDGLLRLFTVRELVGVLAHEISHIRHNDTWVMCFADVVSRITGSLSLLGQLLVLINLPLLFFGDYSLPWGPLLMMMFAPIISALLQLALSRTREFDADLDAARLSADPAGLAAALAKLEEYQKRIMRRLFIPGHRGVEPSLLRTHPKTEERVRRLLDLEEELQGREIPAENSHLILPPHLRGRTRSRLGGLWS
jgi:heat shock protein HtpX